VGNKNDLANKKVVKTETAMKVADTNDLLCIETSAKNSSNVETAFINLVSDILQKVEAGAQYGKKTTNTVELNQNAQQQQQGGWCC